LTISLILHRTPLLLLLCTEEEHPELAY
jgi:hypothetical protein